MFPEGRIFDFLIVGIVALIVVGPKDLPLLMRKVGQFVAKMRGMAAEFRASFDEMARQSELDELRREVDAMRAVHGGDLSKAVAIADPHVQQVFDDIHSGIRGGEVQLHPPTDHQSTTATPMVSSPIGGTVAEGRPPARPPETDAASPARSSEGEEENALPPAKVIT